MSTLQDVLTFSRAQAQTDSNGLTNTNGIIFANEALVDFHRRLVNNSIDASQIQEAYRDASVPASGNGSTFLYPSDAMFLKAIEINYQGTDPQGYIKAEQVDHANLAGDTSFSWLRVNQSASSPRFADNGDWYEIFPAFTAGDNLSQAIRIIYFQKPTEYSSVSDTISYPVSLDYRIIGWRICANYKRSLLDFDSATAFDNEYFNRVKELVGTLGRGTQQPIQVQNLNIGANGWQF